MAIADRFYRIVVDALTHDRLTLPTLPEVALRIQALLRDEDVAVAAVVKEIQSDPALAVRLLRVANSAAVRGGRSVDSIQQAVTRLGLQYTRLLVNGLVLEQMFRSNSPMLKERLGTCWRDSVEVAALARALAAQCTLLQPELAMLGGLIHRVGTLPILRMAEAHTDAIDTPAELDEVIDRLAPRVGSMVLRAWHFPAELVDLPVQWPDLRRAHEGAADYADVVIVAVLRLRADKGGEPVPDGIPAFAKLDLEPDFALGSEGPLASSYQESLGLLRAA
ncbi:HDOD domain-containing protein [Fontimonas sp. SYSU GA230001]|uniref:HDOD domain-containing protein n=1 Tax=Fontimonas sp. SYSU GA230001 TaxID=3142450 RepID=UPI0032B51139